MLAQAWLIGFASTGLVVAATGVVLVLTGAMLSVWRRRLTLIDASP